MYRAFWNRTEGTVSSAEGRRDGQRCAPHHARPACRGVVRVFVDLVLPLMVEEEFLGEGRGRQTDSHTCDASDSRRGLGLVPSPCRRSWRSANDEQGSRHRQGVESVPSFHAHASGLGVCTALLPDVDASRGDTR